MAALTGRAGGEKGKEMSKYDTYPIFIWIIMAFVEVEFEEERLHGKRACSIAFGQLLV